MFKLLLVLRKALQSRDIKRHHTQQINSFTHYSHFHSLTVLIIILMQTILTQIVRVYVFQIKSELF